MVQVKGTRGGMISVNILGVNNVIRNLAASKILIETQAELELVRNANLVQQEVQESIAGNRAEPRSVDTGEFANSVDIDASNLKENSISIFSDVEQAKYLEYGTSRISPRRHFGNTKSRVESEVVNNMKKALKLL